MRLYVDYMSGKSKWQRCAEDEIDRHRTEVDFFITWQRYCNELRGEFGEVFGNWVFDFDHENDPNIAKRDCLRVYSHFVALGVHPENLRLFFSGSKGFHLEIDYRSYMEKPAFDLHLIYKELYKLIEVWLKPEKHNSTIDGSIYSLRRMWRYPNTRHSKTGLYCIPVTHDELRLSMDQIRDLAKAPRGLSHDEFVPDWAMKNTFNDARTRHWRQVEDFEQRKTLIIENTGGYPPCMQRIFDEGLPEGTRNNTIYLLARFLKEFKEENAIHADLLDLARKSGEFNTREIGLTIGSALKREGSFVSCGALSYWCNKQQCDLFAKKEHSGHMERVEKAFNHCSGTEALEALKISITNGEWRRQLSTGINILDQKTKVLQDSVIVVGSLSDAGKTSFGITLIKHNPDKRVFLLAIEEGRERSALRLWRAQFTGFSNIQIYTGRIGSITPEDIQSMVFLNSASMDFIIIDQLINLSDTPAEERLKYKAMMEKFREIAREFRKPIFILHQLNRMAVRDDEPRKEHLAEGADIERLATDVWLLYRRKHEGRLYNLLKIDKNKNYKSPIIVPLEYDFKTNTFRDYPFDEIDWKVFEKLNIDQSDYFYGAVEEDITL